MKYRLLIAYDGTDYAGWQRQTNALAIQQVVEQARGEGNGPRRRGARRRPAPTPASTPAARRRTSPCRPVAGRPARPAGRSSTARTVILPAAIRVLAASAADDSFHARKSASFKVYAYRLCRAPVIDPFRAPFVVPGAAAGSISTRCGRPPP